MRITKLFILTLLLLLIRTVGVSQQLSLGNTPYIVNKAAVLELNSDKQGLLFPRINDTANINTLTPPDGMVIYFVPSKQLMLRSNGAWKAMTFASSLSNYWSIEGNANGVVKNIGTTDNYDLPFITNNLERLRITSSGNVGIGKTNPAEKLDVVGNVRFSGALMPGGSAGTLGYVLTSSGANAAPTWQDGTTFITSMSWLQNGNTLSAQKNFGTVSNHSLPFITNNLERMRLTSAGLLGIGTTSPSTLLHVSGTNPLTLEGVQTGTTTSTDSVLTITSGLVKKLPVSTFQTQLNGTGFIKASGTTISYDNNSYTVANAAITGATKTKITYDSKGLVTAGADATTSDIAEGSNLYYTDARVRAAALTGLSTATATAVTATDNLLTGIGKLQGQINALPTNSTALLKANNLSDLNNATTARTNLGATTVGSNFFTLTNPSAVTFPRINADNTVSALTASTFRSAIGAGTGDGTVSSASVVSANGFAGSVATSTTTPAITISTTVTGLVKGNGTALSAATAGTDYVAPNAAITGATKTKITYDSKGLVTAGTDATTDDIGEGSNQYFTQARVRSTALTGYTVGANTTLAATDDVITALGKIQAQLNAKGTGSVSSFSAGNLSPLFSTSVSNASSTPALSFSLSNAAANSIFGNFTGTSTAPSYNAATADGQFLVRRSGALTFGTIASADIPTLNQNTTGSAGSISGTNVITNSNLRQSTGLSVIGNAGSTTANVADITGTADGVLRVNSAGTSLGFGTIATGGIADDAVTYSKIQNISTNNRLLGRATTGAGSVEEITIGSGLTLTGNTLSATGSGTNLWSTLGNSGTSWNNHFIGTTDNVGFRVRTNNTERVVVDSLGNVGIGSNDFEPLITAREKLLVDAGTTNSYNLIVGKGDINNYLQLNIQNSNNGNFASSDVVATANNGSEGSVYIDMGINSQGYASGSSSILNGSNTAYLYATGSNFLIGNGAKDKDLIFFTNTGATGPDGTEKMRILSTGNVGIGKTAPAEKLDIVGNLRFSGALMPNGLAGTSGQVLVSNGTNSAPTWSTVSNSTNTWIHGGNTLSSMQRFGTVSNYDIPFITNNTERMRLTSTGNVAIGNNPTFTASPNAEKLLVDAGTTGSYNLISAKGSINNYLQMNIQNRSAGASASTDIVATADNGSELTNYIDMGINGSGNTAGYFGSANDAYIYNLGQDLLIGTGTATKSLKFLTGGGDEAINTRMIIDGDGDVGVNTATPGQKLDVNGDMGVQTNLYIDKANANSGTVASGSLILGGTGSGEAIASKRTSGGNQYGIDFYAGSSNRMSITNGGNVGIGVSTPADKLTVAGVVAPSVDNTYTLGKLTSRWTFVYASSGYVSSSDRRLKTNIKNLNYGLKEVMALEPVRYNWKTDSIANPRLGFIAQDVRKIVPEVVIGNEEKETLGINYQELVPVLISAIKEQQQQIEDLKQQQAKDKAALKEIGELKQQMKELMKRMEKAEKN